MTDKQIIIDGVDVSGCEYHSLNKNNCSLCSLSNNLICSYKPFCYYKQLKAKEQECERLKRQRQADKGLITSTGKMNYELLQEYDRLKTALTEIKEIAEKLKNFYEELGKCEDLTVVRLKQILQKISECEEKND